MRKAEFLKKLRGALNCVERQERERTLAYYSEIIDDKVEAGMTEEMAVAELGSIQSVAAGIISDATERGHLRKQVNPWTIILIAIGSPIWLSILLALSAVLLAIYAVLWSLIVAFFALELALGVCGIASIIGFFTLLGNPILAGYILAVGLICSAVAFALLIPIIAAAKYIARCSAKLAKMVWNKLTKKGGKK